MNCGACGRTGVQERSTRRGRDASFQKLRATAGVSFSMTPRPRRAPRCPASRPGRGRASRGGRAGACRQERARWTGWAFSCRHAPAHLAPAPPAPAAHRDADRRGSAQLTENASTGLPQATAPRRPLRAPRRERRDGSWGERSFLGVQENSRVGRCESSLSARTPAMVGFRTGLVIQASTDPRLLSPELVVSCESTWLSLDSAWPLIGRLISDPVADAWRRAG